MPLKKDAPLDGLEQTYAAMKICTRAKYDGVTLDDYTAAGSTTNRRDSE